MKPEPKTLGEMSVGDLCEFVDVNGATHFVQVACIHDGRVTLAYEDGMLGWRDTSTPATPVIALTVAPLQGVLDES